MSRCSYLGLEDDPQTALEFPSDGNFCHRATPAAAANPAYQKAFCLSSEHVSCPVFKLTGEGPLPRDIIYRDSKQSFWDKVDYRAKMLAILLVLLAAVLAGAWGLNGIFSPQDVIPEGTLRITPVQSQRMVATGSSIAPYTPFSPDNPTATLNLTGSDCPPPAGWIPYTVIPTDSIFRLSLIFGISVTELQSANCMSDGTILRPGDQIFVPSLQTNTPALSDISPTVTGTLQPVLTSTPRPRPRFTSTHTKVPKPNPPSPIPPTSTSSPSDTPAPVVPTSTPQPPDPTTQPTNTTAPQPATPTSPPPPAPTGRPTNTSAPPPATPTSPPPPPTD